MWSLPLGPGGKTVHLGMFNFIRRRGALVGCKLRKVTYRSYKKQKEKIGSKHAISRRLLPMGKAAVLLLLPQLALSLRPAGGLSHPRSDSSSTPLRSTTRRAAAQSALFAAAAAATSLQLPARAHASIEPGLSLDDLPSKAVQAYRQYWPAMQLAGDFYVFELKELTFSPGNWDQIGE